MIHPFEKLAKDHFGVTHDLRETGYILSDGTMLDLSGRHYATGYVKRGESFVPKRGEMDYLRHQRAVDHRELPPEIQDAFRKKDAHSAVMFGFLEATGAIRVMPGVGFSVVRMPTVEALCAFMNAWKVAYGDDEVVIDIISPDGYTVGSAVIEDPDLDKLVAELERAGPVRGGSLSGRKSLYEQLAALRPKIAAAAQKVYDEWEQDAEGLDEELGAGGICSLIADAAEDMILNKVPEAGTFAGGHDGDDHAWLVVQLGDETYGVDIPAGIYETGGGYRWTKRSGIKFKPEHVLIWKIDR